MSYKSSLKLPFTNGRRFVLGWILHIIPILNIFSFGYLFRVMEETVAGKTELPPWEGWARLFVKGVQLLVIAAIWILPVFLIYTYLTEAVSFDILTILLLAKPIPPGYSPLMLLTLIIPAIPIYFTPQALVDFVREKSFKSAFRARTIIRQTLNRRYLVRFLAAFGVFLAYFAVTTGITSVVPYVSFVIPIKPIAVASVLVLHSLATAGINFIFFITAFALVSGLYSKVIVPPRPRIEEDIKELKESAEELKEVHEDVIEGDGSENSGNKSKKKSK